MSIKAHNWLKYVSAIFMIAALLFLTTANFWVYGFKSSKQAACAVANTGEEEDGGNTSVPNPVEEKNANGLQNLSEYLHDGHHTMDHYPLITTSFGNRHDIITLPIHHPELLTPPPKTMA